jgi:RNA polymerase sigma factor for flagellar operon FliA
MEYLHLVKYSAGRVAVRIPNYIEIDDLFASGLLGLIQAIEKYDQNREIKFETYAYYRIRGAMLDELRKQDWFPRSLRHKEKKIESVMSKLENKLGRHPRDSELAEELNISMDEYYKWIDEVSLTNLTSLDKNIPSNNEGLYSVISESHEKKSKNDPFNHLEKKELLNIIAACLEEMQENERIVLSLYYYEDMTLKEIGKVLDVSESRVCQIHTKSILRLKSRVRRIIEGAPGVVTTGSICKSI